MSVYVISSWDILSESAAVFQLYVVKSCKIKDHSSGHHTCKVFDVDISSEANELLNLLGVSPDGCHVEGRLPSLVPLVDLVLLSG